MTTSTATKRQPLKRLSLVQSTASIPSPSSTVVTPDIASARSDAFSSVDTLPTPHSSISSVPLPSLSSPRWSSANLKNARRKSSIYYVTAGSESEKSSQGSISPVNETDISPSIENFGREHRMNHGSRTIVLNDPPPPLTLVEKHADLLRFIAQKESRCLELRQHLATQEAELLALKRKWERIVSRGLHDVPRLPPSEPDPSSQTTVLSGLRESVQGVGRLFIHLGDRRIPGSGAPLRHASDSSVSTTASSTSQMSESSMSSVGYTDSTLHAGFEDDVMDVQTSRPVSISLSKAVRRRAYESSPPTTPPPVIYASDVTIRRIPSPTNRCSSIEALNTKKRNSIASGSLPPASSIPGALAGAPLAALVDSVSKKLGQIQSQGYDQHPVSRSVQKRASKLLSDASHTLLAAIAPISRASAEPDSGQRKPVSPTANEALSQSSRSLIDDDDMLGDETGTRWAAIEALSLDPVKTNANIAQNTLEAETRSSDSGSDVWKW